MNPLSVFAWLAVGVAGFAFAMTVLLAAGFGLLFVAVRIGQAVAIPASDVLLMIVMALAGIAGVGAALTYSGAERHD